jgi:hypothetical protein
MPTDSFAKFVTVVDQILRRRDISPGKRHLSTFLRALFFTSLKTEEARSLEMRIVVVDPEDPNMAATRTMPDRWSIVPLGKRILMTPHTLAKIASAADPWSSSIAVFFDDDGQAFIWGFIDQAVGFSRMLVHEAQYASPPPGIVQVQINGIADLSVFRGSTFIARLRQDTLIRSEPNVFVSGPVREGLWAGFELHVASVASAIGLDGFEAEADWNLDLTEKVYLSENGHEFVINTCGYWWFGALCRLLINIGRYRHGGALLITASSADLNVTYPIAYPRLRAALVNSTVWALKDEEAFFVLRQECRKSGIRSVLFQQWAKASRNLENYESELTGCVRFVSSLSCVDGLILASPDLMIRGFGVELLSKQETDVIYISSAASPDAKTLRQASPSNYGTRHRSMFRYCFAHPGSVGFVISQDGDLRVIRRVQDQLIVWENPKILASTQRARRADTASAQPRRPSDGFAQTGEITDDITF